MTREPCSENLRMTIRFDGRVAIVTGAGNGLGRAHALGLASRGAKVVVNDFGGARDGSGGSLPPAEAVVEEIRASGGVAMADGADVSNFEQVKAMVARATKEWGSVDLLCANAGILRDRSFGKMEVSDFTKVLEVHLMGTFYCCKAAWDGMRERNYGRIAVTTSSAGLYGNFGQANYGAAKAGMIGLMNVLAEEGRKNDIRVNTISPTAATRMTEELLPPQALALMKPEAITPAVLYLLGEDAPTRTIMGAGAGSFAVIRIVETEGINLAQSDWTPDAVSARFAEISDMSTAKALEGAFQQTQKYVSQALPAFLRRYGEAMPQLAAAITAFPPDALRQWSEALGQPTFIGSSGRVFPKAFKASPLLRAWLRRLDSLGVQFELRHRWTGWDENGRMVFQ